jgi:DNA-binding MarR family transcriptional regulator
MARVRKDISAEEPDPSTVADRLHSAAIRVLRSVRPEDTQAGITAARLSALSILVFAGPVTVGQLAESEQVSVPTVSRMIRTMVGDGLVHRQTDAADRRVVWLRATDKGARLLQVARRRRIEALSRRLEHLPPEDLRGLLHMADVIEVALEA